MFRINAAAIQIQDFSTLINQNIENEGLLQKVDVALLLVSKLCLVITWSAKE